MNNRRMIFFKYYMHFVGFAGQLIYLIQAYKIWATKSCEDISLLGFLISTIAAVSFAIYGYIIADKLLIKTYVFGSVSALICLAMILIYS